MIGNMESNNDIWKILATLVFIIVFINPASSLTADDLYKTGLGFLYSGEFIKANQAFDKAITIDPNFKEAWLYKGHALYNLGEFEKAIEAYDRAIALDPNLKDAWLNKGVALATLSESQKAIEAFDKALTIDPTYKEAWLGKGIVLNSLGEYHIANEAFDRAIAIDPYLEFVWAYKGIALYGMGEYEKSIEALDRSIAINPYIEEAKKLRASAIRKIAEQTATPPMEDKKWIMIGGIGIFVLIGIIAYRNRNRNESNGEVASPVRERSVKGKIGVYKFLDNAFGYGGNNWTRTIFMGAIFGVLTIGLYVFLIDSSFNLRFNNKFAIIFAGLPAFWITRRLYWQHRRAQIIALMDAGEDIAEQIDSLVENNPYLYSDVEYINIAINTDPIDKKTFDRKIQNYTLNNPKKAVEVFDKELSVNQYNKEAWFYKGIAHGYLGQDQEEIKSFDTAIAIDPNYKQAWYKKGLALRDHHSAIEAFDKALSIDPNFIWAWYGKGERFSVLGEFNKAIEAFDKALSIDPSLGLAWSKKGHIFYDLGEYNKAIEAFDREISVDHFPQFAWYQKGLVFDKLGEFNKAIEAFDKAIAIKPNYEEAKTNRKLMIKKISEKSTT